MIQLLYVETVKGEGETQTGRARERRGGGGAEEVCLGNMLSNI